MIVFQVARAVAFVVTTGLSGDVGTAADGVHTALAFAQDRLPGLTIPPYTREVPPATALTEGVTEDWLMVQPAPEGDAAWQCLTEAIYFEARGESLQGQVGVAEVILNRVDSPLYPRSVCGVVRQRGSGGCQFSYICDGRADRMREKASADLAGRIARAMLDGAPRQLTDGATHFHTRSVRPGWSKRYAHTATIGAHVFYRKAGVNG
jgi:spore germination cell wall hydrolase CwlJ-like protein